MQAIQTKYFGPTNHRGARIKAICAAASVTVPYDHALSVVENHIAAADVLLRRLDWSGRWVAGGLSDGSYAHVKAG